MRIIIAGGSGLIGRALTSDLAIDGNKVTILSRNPGKVTGMPDGVMILQWDGRTVQAWGNEMNSTDVVINLVGENLAGKGYLPSRWTNLRKRRLLCSRVDAGKALSKAIEISDQKPAVFVQASGVGIYGIDREEQFTEESVVGKDFLANLSKQWEASSEPVEAQGVRRVVIRSGIVLNSNGGALRPLLLPYKIFIGGPIGDGQQIYSWIHIDDEVDAIQFLIEHDHARGIFNLSSPNPITNKEFGKTISILMRRPNYLHIPGFVMRLAFGEVASMILEGQKVLPKKLLEYGYAFRYPTLNAALMDLLKR